MSTEQAIQEFIVESREALGRLENDLLAMEAGAVAPEKIAGIFRAVHTIKGTSGFLGFAKLEASVHHGETLLSLMRDGRLTPGRESVSALLALVDLVARYLAAIEATGREGSTDPAPVIERLRQLLDQGAAAQQAAPPPEVTDVLAPEGEESLRIDVKLLDALMDLVGELVLVRNQTLRLSSESKETELAGPIQRLNLIVSELQQSVMKTRMQPIRNVWTKLPRVVRDLAIACGKRVRLDMEGAATELDRTILDAVKAPLTHLVRNAIDHGIEPPAARAAAGKPPEGLLTLRAYHEGGCVNVEVSDDGVGVDWAAVARKAASVGLATQEQLARAEPTELAAYLFAPGFTTAAKVTTMSGRGVGLDVARSNVERIGGTIDLRSPAGGGTTVRIKIPLTLAIVPALLVTSGGQRYALPQVDVVELVRVERAALETVLGVPVFRLRGRLLTVLDLDRDLRPDAAGPREGAAHIVVLRADARTFGLLVEDVLETEEIVVKPLPRQVKDVKVFAGATIMGDGRVALILDAQGLAQRASLEAHTRAAPTRAPAEQEAAGPATEPLLLVEVCGGERAAIPLASVSRLEELAVGRIERSGGAEVVQYRDEVLPLIRVSRLLGVEDPARAGATIPVVIHSGPSGQAGLAVERVVDIVEEPIPAAERSPRPGVRCTAIVQQRITEVLDVPALVASAHGRQDDRAEADA